MLQEATVELIDELIQLIDTSYEVTSVVDNTGSYTLSVACTKWLRPCKKIDIGGFTFKITDFVPNESITVENVKNSHVPVNGIYNAPAPVYLYGTVRQVNAQINAIGNSVDFTPLIYFIETYTEDYDETYDTAITYTTDISIVFLDDSNYEDWGKAEEHYIGAINPTRKLLDEFLTVVRASGKVGELEGYRVINHSNFGVFQTNQGHVRRLIDAELSGCELRIALPICVNLSCENKC